MRHGPGQQGFGRIVRAARLETEKHVEHDMSYDCPHRRPIISRSRRGTLQALRPCQLAERNICVSRLWLYEQPVVQPFFTREVTDFLGWPLFLIAVTLQK